jgi:hypothetical protein
VQVPVVRTGQGQGVGHDASLKQECTAATASR